MTIRLLHTYDLDFVVVETIDPYVATVSGTQGLYINALIGHHAFLEKYIYIFSLLAMISNEFDV